jgi:DNA primase
VQAFELGWSLPEWSSLAQHLENRGFDKKQAVEAGLLTRSERGTVYDRFRSRLMFPIKNLSGQVIAFGGRIIDDADASKYINTNDTPLYKKGDNLYGLFQARRAVTVKKAALLTEGYLDVITLHQFGYDNACGVLGTALTPEQIKRLMSFCSSFELIFDGDSAGRKAALRSAEMLLARGLRCKVVLLPDGEDIDSLLKGSPDQGLGPAAFEEARMKAPDGLNFCMRVLNRDFAPRDIMDWIKHFSGSLEQPELFSRYLPELARGLNIEERSLRRLSADAGSGGQKSSGVPAVNVSGTDAVKVSALPALKEPDTEEQILSFALCYPQYIGDLADAGAEFVFSSSRACIFWEKIVKWKVSAGKSDILTELDDKQKAFVVRSRMNMPPPDKGKEDCQKQQLCAGIRRIIVEKHNSCLRQLFSGLNDDASRKVLIILRDKLTEKLNAEHKKNE